MARIRTKYKIIASLIVGAALFAIAESVIMPVPTVKADYYGSMVAPDSSIHVPVDIKKGCKIAAFGVAPWLAPGAVRSPAWEVATQKALLGMGVPVEAAQRAIVALRSGSGGSPVGMSDSHGVSTIDNVIYYPTFNTTYKIAERYAVCNESRTNFGNNQRQEYAIVYRVTDASGYVWHVGEFLACGNVSLFSPAPKGWMPGDGTPNGNGSGAGISNVPEPSSWTLFLAALVVMLYIVWRKRK